MRTELSEDLPQIMGDRVQLQQVLMNLMINSVEAMKDVGRATRALHQVAERRRRAPDGLGQRYPVWVCHRSRRTRSLIRFFTTKGDGTGHGTANQPLHRGIAWRPLVVSRQPSTRREFSVHPAQQSRHHELTLRSRLNSVRISSHGWRAALQGIP